MSTTHTRATNPPSPRQAESSWERLANAVVGKIAAGHADQGQAFRDAQAVALRQMAESSTETRL